MCCQTGRKSVDELERTAPALPGEDGSRGNHTVYSRAGERERQEGRRTYIIARRTSSIGMTPPFSPSMGSANSVKASLISASSCAVMSCSLASFDCLARVAAAPGSAAPPDLRFGGYFFARVPGQRRVRWAGELHTGGGGCGRFLTMVCCTTRRRVSCRVVSYRIGSYRFRIGFVRDVNGCSLDDVKVEIPTRRRGPGQAVAARSLGFRMTVLPAGTVPRVGKISDRIKTRRLQDAGTFSPSFTYLQHSTTSTPPWQRSQACKSEQDRLRSLSHYAHHLMRLAAEQTLCQRTYGICSIIITALVRSHSRMGGDLSGWAAMELDAQATSSRQGALQS